MLEAPAIQFIRLSLRLMLGIGDARVIQITFFQIMPSLWLSSANLWGNSGIATVWVLGPWRDFAK